jgi:hypothetical protein
LNAALATRGNASSLIAALMIVTGSIWIMSDLGQMMPGGSISTHMQH